MPFDAAGADRARAADDRSARRRAARSSKACTGGRAIPMGSRSTRRSDAIDTPLARNAAALPVHQRQPLGSGATRTSRSSARQPMPPGHALYPTDLTRAADRRLRRRAPGREGRDLRPVHDRAPQGARSRRPAVSRRVRAVRHRRGRRRCARPPICRPMPRSRTSCGCAPTRSSPTTTTRATSRGSS